MNPCDNCIIKVNCTAVCAEKTNQKILIQHAIRQHKGCLNIRAYADRYAKLINDLRQVNEDEQNIINRHCLLKKGD